jgi:mannose-6-phosphate isomerase-like protein (cupin superfamily)
MHTYTTIEPGTVLDLAHDVVGVDGATRRAHLMERRTDGPARIDGFTIGAPMVSGDPPHNGEMHPDGDELLFVVSGRIEVHLELDDGHRRITLEPGQAVVVPRGTWHQVHHVEPAQMIHITPGPNGDHRPRPRD